MRDRALRLKLRKLRVRRTVFGTQERPRLSVYRSSNHIYAHVIDDIAQRTLVAVSSLTPEIRKKIPGGGNIQAAMAVGELLAKRCLETGIKQVVFDRNGRLYHGRVKALAEKAKNAGLQI